MPLRGVSYAMQTAYHGSEIKHLRDVIARNEQRLVLVDGFRAAVTAELDADDTRQLKAPFSLVSPHREALFGSKYTRYHGAVTSFVKTISRQDIAQKAAQLEQELEKYEVTTRAGQDYAHLMHLAGQEMQSSFKFAALGDLMREVEERVDPDLMIGESLKTLKGARVAGLYRNVSELHDYSILTADL